MCTVQGEHREGKSQSSFGRLGKDLMSEMKIGLSLTG